MKAVLSRLRRVSLIDLIPLLQLLADWECFFGFSMESGLGNDGLPFLKLALQINKTFMEIIFCF